MKIGMLGLTFGYGEYGSKNKGCEALAYAFLEVLNILAKKEGDCYEAVLFIPYSLDYVKKRMTYGKSVKQGYYPQKKYSNVKVSIMYYYQVKKRTWISSRVKECDVVYDFSNGDSFADIYGRERFTTYTRLKKQVINYGVPLVLGSQTVGPFYDEKLKKEAVDIIRNCKKVFVRDELSKEYVKQIAELEPVMTTDIAFFLPSEKISVNANKEIKVGINVSGLLWKGGYTGDNQFGLTVDYQEYCKKIVEELLSKGNYEIYLIPHAFSREMKSMDNDMVACEEMHRLYPDTVLAPYFKNAVEVKSYIACMDAFVGARMHATIAAYSKKIPVIPFSYSRKFEGLYGSLEYPYVIKGREDSTEDAYLKTIQWIEQRSLLKNEIDKKRYIVDEKNNMLLEETASVLQSLKKI